MAPTLTHSRAGVLPQHPAARSAGLLAAASGTTLAVAVGLTATSMFDNVAADTASGGWGVLLGAVAELLFALFVLVGWLRLRAWPGRAGGIGSALTVAGLCGMVAGGVATFATGDHEALGLAYVGGALLTFVGLIVLAVSAWRAGVLPKAPMVLLVVAFLPLLPPVIAVLAAVALVWLAIAMLRSRASL